MNVAPESLKLEGALTFASMPGILGQTRDFLARTDLPQALVIDLSVVSEVDSSAVALLLYWRRAAQGLHKRLEFINIPDNLKALAALYDVSDMVQATPQ